MDAIVLEEEVSSLKAKRQWKALNVIYRAVIIYIVTWFK